MTTPASGLAGPLAAAWPGAVEAAGAACAAEAAGADGGPDGAGGRGWPEARPEDSALTAHAEASKPAVATASPTRQTGVRVRAGLLVLTRPGYGTKSG